ncbi:SDR family NAD(P)-dependent oxidoreductase [Microbulbifer thermotolerans]|uniref:Short-chain dehydrogenase n=1 Tax=Microbulbifer thermotolerans TaxID=252514 RepID=A0A143HMK6_MICTH|nr:SDR family NAD(P)-dependent oxidoreductase [Microbulbifer thermotolerans]AMX02761.1 short-chain dehydrogenase [Microbulbifer thermotolerans]MCX2779616.1 SDR family NAD(P)-dependent oxidoreductase [Microbulbifer thermotolerans]MCX2782582.1 SDR family NAD(P)-dependent oxidoreductase [Microbulbifer thermotolerans]MCX2804953.1 SDR family NAD(P)-dependent oxidoreductase [Microbulbifer thermotolerans]MCX2831683.1 SDR family NAD(P)-dependent oxidoreductase [Microbulbifer thermotolerans]
MKGGDVVVVTGAAGGLGWAIVEALVARGRSRFALVDISVEALEERVRELHQRRISAECFVADLSCEHAVAELVKQLRARYQRLGLLVNNAGITHRSLSTQTSNAVIRRVMAVDYHAPVELAQGLLEELRAAEGCIVNISSMAGWMPVLGRAGYCAAKSALHQYFETFREEVRDLGIKVLMVYPSFVATNIERNALSGDGGRARHKQSTVGRVRSAEWMAEKIVTALEQGRERLFPRDRTLLGAYLYKFFPRLFMKQMVKRFRVELDVARGTGCK